ncbi:MAG: prepilin peptidase [Candidatus Vogelbacteria bacterium]|nr:prepilin peptidase [Candidatus Vogelbacteria bacterium]
MNIILAVFIFILGTIIGSFLNVIILRYNTGRGVTGRSACFSCGGAIKWFSLVPVLSFVAQRGKCKNCKSKISFQYPIVELMTGLLFLALFWKFGFGNLFFYFFISALLIIIAVYDFNHKIVPDGVVYLLILSALARLVYQYFVFGDMNATLSFLVGGIISMFLSALWLFSNGRWMGLGDAKLVLGLGWLLPPCQGASAFILSFWIGAVVGIILMLFQKTRMTSEIPFAPFLIAGFFIVLILDVNLLYLPSASCLIGFKL